MSSKRRRRNGRRSSHSKKGGQMTAFKIEPFKPLVFYEWASKQI